MNAQHIIDAYARIRHQIHTTPVMHSRLLNERLGCEVILKCENLQKVGAFKARGAANAVLQLTEAEVIKGVATHSSGNHGAALAFAARERGIPCWVVMPANAPQVKKDAVAAYGAQIIECESTLAARESTLEKTVQATGAQFIPPYDDERIIAGQGTAALELYQQLAEQGQPLPEFLLAPVGGGGLLAGTALYSKSVAPGVTVIGTEPKGADDCARGFNSKQRVTDAKPNTIADGLRTLVGETNFPIICDYVDEVLTVSESAIIEAMALVWTRTKLIIEPSSAVPIAAILENPTRFAGRRVAVILSGGNVELGQLPF